MPKINFNIKNPPPEMLEYRDGAIVRADGGDLREYLEAWAEFAGLKDGDPVCVVNRQGLAQIKRDALLWRSQVA